MPSILGDIDFQSMLQNNLVLINAYDWSVDGAANVVYAAKVLKITQ